MVNLRGEMLVSPEGIESKNGDFANTLMACDFWR
jgi:hypothetical protein